MTSRELKTLNFNKKRNKLIYEAHMLSELQEGLSKFYNDVYVNYIRKCDAETFDEDFEIYCEQLDVLYKDKDYYTRFSHQLSHTNYCVQRQWNQPK